MIAASQHMQRICKMEGILRIQSAMGLDAVVYKNIRTLEPGLRERIRIADSATGQLEFLTQGPPDPNYNDELLAVGVRIGNAALVDWLREEFRSRWDGRCQGILETVLFSS